MTIFFDKHENKREERKKKKNGAQIEALRALFPQKTPIKKKNSRFLIQSACPFFDNYRKSKERSQDPRKNEFIQKPRRT